LATHVFAKKRKKSQPMHGIFSALTLSMMEKRIATHTFALLMLQSCRPTSRTCIFFGSFMSMENKKQKTNDKY
jgi:hypothetical protein